MRVLMAGLGDIARKAYLPVLATTPGIELHLATRNRAVLTELGATYRIAHLHDGLDAALAATSFDAAFVHSATAAHPSMVAALLHHGAAVFVDKPLADSFDEAARLVDLADRQGRLLGIGFNRRFAPDYVALRTQPRAFMLMQKHRRAQPDMPRSVVFDDFIHVVDTLRFLAPAPIQRTQIETIVRDGLLSGVTVTLAGGGHHAIGTMQRESGLDEERLDIIAGDRRRSVLNLSETGDQNGIDTRTRRGDWIPVTRQRGFEAMCADFLAGVREARPTAAEDILATHRLCEDIVRHAERQPG
jgi:virulence factor